MCCTNVPTADIRPVYFIPLTCLPHLSSVEKGRQITGQTQKRREEPYKGSSETCSDTGRTWLLHCTHPSHGGGPEVRCAAFWSWREHSWQRAVCQTTGSLAQGLLDGQMESLWGNEQRKMLKKQFFCRQRSDDEHMEMRRKAICSHS